MFGLLDKFFVLSEKSSSFDDENFSFQKYFIDKKLNNTACIFLPRKTGLNLARITGLLPKGYNLLVYEIPPALLSANPKNVVTAMDVIRKDFEKTIAGMKNEFKNMAFVGYSAGTMPAIYLANRFDCKKLVVVCSLDRLGWGIFKAPAAKKIKHRTKKLGYDVVEYDAIIDEVNPVSNVNNIGDVDVLLILAAHDSFTPLNGGEKLLQAMLRNDCKVTVKKNKFLGHVMTLVLSRFVWKKFL